MVFVKKNERFVLLCLFVNVFNIGTCSAMVRKSEKLVKIEFSYDLNYFVALKLVSLLQSTKMWVIDNVFTQSFRFDALKYQYFYSVVKIPNVRV